jgi:hypothetical protein
MIKEIPEDRTIEINSDERVQHPPSVNGARDLYHHRLPQVLQKDHLRTDGQLSLLKEARCFLLVSQHLQHLFSLPRQPLQVLLVKTLYPQVLRPLLLALRLLFSLEMLS